MGHGPFIAFPWTWLLLFPLFLNSLLWKSVSLYQSRENSRMNPIVECTHQSTSTVISLWPVLFHSCSPPPVIIQTESQLSFHHKYVKIKTFPTTITPPLLHLRRDLCFISSNVRPEFTFPIVGCVFSFLKFVQINIQISSLPCD